MSNPNPVTKPLFDRNNLILLVSLVLVSGLYYYVLQYYPDWFQALVVGILALITGYLGKIDYPMPRSIMPLKFMTPLFVICMIFLFAVLQQWKVGPVWICVIMYLLFMSFGIAIKYETSYARWKKQEFKEDIQ